MGGDGGVIASNRRYMRGAGSAECTADHPSQSKNNNNNNDGRTTQEVAREVMMTCALTKTPFEFVRTSLQEHHPSIVACPYGLLYQKEAALQALLRRRQRKRQQHDDHPSDNQQQQQQFDELGDHIRGLKDLYPVHFHLVQEQRPSSSSSLRLVPTCPVTGLELNGTTRAILLVSTTTTPATHVNVISERAMKEMGMEALQVEYGPFDPNCMIRLAPLPSQMQSLQEELQLKRTMEEEETNKNSNKKSNKKKRKQQQMALDDDNVVVTTVAAGSGEATTTTSPTPKIIKTDSSVEQAAHIARERASLAVQKNQVLSSLFTRNT